MSAFVYGAAVLSAVANGSFCAVFKTDKVATLNLHPFWFQLYCSCGVTLSCFLLCAFLPLNPHIKDGYTANFEFVPLAMAAGSLFVMSIVSWYILSSSPMKSTSFFARSQVLSFAAIPLLGVATVRYCEICGHEARHTYTN
jgi:hypothetical protein